MSVNNDFPNLNLLSPAENDFMNHPDDRAVQLGVYRLSTEVPLPEYATDGAAAFDLRAFFDGSAVEAFDCYNRKQLVLPQENVLSIPGLYRVKIPTGLIFDIPEGYRMDVNVRGGTGWRGLTLCNNTGIIDWDYTKETFILLQNVSEAIVDIKNGERLAQAMIERKLNVQMEDLKTPPEQKTQRTGGFNSTGRV